MPLIVILIKERAMQALAIKIFKLIYINKIHQILVKKAGETSTEIDDNFVKTLYNFVQSL